MLCSTVCSAGGRLRSHRSESNYVAQLVVQLVFHTEADVCFTWQMSDGAYSSNHSATRTEFCNTGRKRISRRLSIPSIIDRMIFFGDTLANRKALSST